MNKRDKQVIRALATEEAARVAIDQPYFIDTGIGKRQEWVKQEIASKIRALAPLPSGLVAVEACHICGSTDAVIIADRLDTCSKGHFADINRMPPGFAAVPIETITDVLYCLSNPDLKFSNRWHSTITALEKIGGK